MAWYDKFLESLYERKVEQTDFTAIYKRMDVDQFFNSLNNLWHPGELIQKIGGREKLDILYKDDAIYSAIDKRIAALLDTRMVINGDNPKLVQFFTEQLEPFERQLKQDFWWTTFHGYGVEQIIYDESGDGTVLGFQREEAWRFEPQRDLVHIKLVHTSNQDFQNQILPYGKWVLTTNNGTSYNPLGDCMAERLITPWIFKCNGWDLWMDFAKRFANGFMHAQIEDTDKAEAVRSALEKSGKSAILVTDKNSTMTMIQPSRDSSLYDLLDSRTSARITRVILGETLTTTIGSVGSYGAAEIHNEVRLEKTRNDIELIKQAFNEVIRQIGDVNGFDPSQLPWVDFIFDPGLNAELAARDAALVATGVKFTKKYFVNKYGLAEDEFDLAPEPAASSWGGFSQEKKRTFLSKDQVGKFLGISEKSDHKCPVHLAPNVTRKSNKQQDEKEEVVEFLNRSAEPPLNVDDLLAAISNSESQAELEKNLTMLFDTRNNGFVDSMTEALYYSAGKGALLGNPERIPNEEE